MLFGIIWYIVAGYQLYFSIPCRGGSAHSRMALIGDIFLHRLFAICFGKALVNFNVVDLAVHNAVFKFGWLIYAAECVFIVCVAAFNKEPSVNSILAQL